jgi:hypothetical protein
MKTSTALTVLAIGAIFAFAVNAHLRFLNFQVIGWVLIVTAIAGLVIPRRGRGWLRRTVLVKEGPERSKDDSSGEPAPDAADAKSAGQQAQGPVERETIVEFTEK